MEERTAERLDKVLVERGLTETRTRGQALISAGLVTVDGQIAEKAGLLVEPDASVEVTGEANPYVSRGGLKLEAALRQFRINASGLRCVDVGAGTGGFTDCLLQRGAAQVTALDVGHGQLAPSLAADPRVTSREGINARYLDPNDFPEQFDLAVVDLSFISLTKVLPAVGLIVRPGGLVVALVKPQFEVGKEHVGSGGKVRDRGQRERALREVREFGRELGWRPRGTMPSPILGGSGARESFVWWQLPEPSPPPPLPQAGEGPDAAALD